MNYKKACSCLEIDQDSEITDTILMVRPVGFRMNEGTISRRFGKEYRKLELNFYKTAIMKGLLNPFLAVAGFVLRQASKLLGKPIFQFLYRIMHALPKPKDV